VLRVGLWEELSLWAQLTSVAFWSSAASPAAFEKRQLSRLSSTKAERQQTTNLGRRREGSS
jgi:hypothetical protein